MWSKTFSKVYPNLRKEDVWEAWSEVEEWPKWDSDIEYCIMNGDFAEGEQFTLKAKNGPKVKITLSEVKENEGFSDYCQFLGARMYDVHDLKDEPEGLRITNTIYVKGALSFIWVNLVAKKVAQSVLKQTDSLVDYVWKNNG